MNYDDDPYFVVVLLTFLAWLGCIALGVALFAGELVAFWKFVL
jgi:hypothetical protein